MSDSSPAERWRRRVLTFPAYALACGAGWALSPIALPALALVDALSRSRWSRCRALSAALVYLSAEVGGLVASFALWVVLRPGSERWLDAHYRLQKRWATLLWRSLVRLYALEVELDVDEREGPTVCLVRHASLVDTLLPVVLLDARPRYVLKRELLADPCLDVVGQRIPNAFVTRRAEQAEEDVAGVRRLAEGLTERDVLVVYPEGTFFTPEKLRKRSEELGAERSARLGALRHVLPPRPRGALAALETCERAGVSILAHSGLGALRSLRHLTDGSLVGARVMVSIRNFEPESVPREPVAFGAWLDRRWQELDEWVEAQRA